jgi:hypothetical protein
VFDHQIGPNIPVGSCAKPVKNCRNSAAKIENEILFVSPFQPTQEIVVTQKIILLHSIKECI